MTGSEQAAAAGSSALRGAARGGLLVRAVFYLLLAYLVLRIATVGGTEQANANGALGLIGRSVLDSVLLGFAAAGFVLFGVVRLRAAWRDHDEPRLRRTTTALQGATSVAIGWIPLSYALGHTQTGSEQSQRQETSKVLGFPGGRELVVVVGVVVLGWAAWQIRGALRRDHEDGLRLEQLRPWLRRVVQVVSASGLLARAVVIAPIGVFLVVAGATFDPQHAKGLDGELLLLTRHGWGTAVLALVALGLLDFAAYAVVEATLRRVDRAA